MPGMRGLGVLGVVALEGVRFQMWTPCYRLPLRTGCARLKPSALASFSSRWITEWKANYLKVMLAVREFEIAIALARTQSLSITTGYIPGAAKLFAGIYGPFFARFNSPNKLPPHQVEPSSAANSPCLKAF